MGQNLVLRAKYVKEYQKDSHTNISYYVLDLSNGIKVSVWPNAKDNTVFQAAHNWIVGKPAEIEWKVDGKWLNATSIVLEPKVEPIPITADPMTLRVTRLACVKASAAFYAGTNATPEAILALAERFEKWAYQGGQK